MTAPRGFRMPLMVAAMIAMVAKHTPRPFEERIANARPPRIPVGGSFRKSSIKWGERQKALVNETRRERAALALEYGLKPTGRQKVRFRRWMRLKGHPAFTRTRYRDEMPVTVGRAA